MRHVVYRDAAGEWRWRFVARNGRVIADSAEGYRSRSGAVRALWRVIVAVRALDITCERCNGLGQVRVAGYADDIRYETCKRCSGSGEAL